MEFIIILLFLLLNGVFAMYEIALVSSSRVRLETLVEKGSKAAKRVLRQSLSPEQTLSTIQIGITLIGLVSGAYSGMKLSHYLEPLLDFCGVYAAEVAVTLVIVIVTYLSLIIGELVPKSLALSNPERYAMLFSPIIAFLTWLCWPFVWLLSASTRLVGHLLGIDTRQTKTMTQDELEVILRQSSEQGIVDENEGEMLRDVFRLSDKHVNELMTPYHELAILRPTFDMQQTIDVICKAKRGKYLLMDVDHDRVMGVVSVKDIIVMMSSDKPFALTSIARPATFLPESTYAQKAIQVFKREKTKFAVVVDEYGATEGIITLHDLTEAIFGDFPNEAEEAEIVRRTDGSLLVEGGMNLDDFMEEMGIASYEDIEEENFTTVGGFVMFLAGELPKTGDVFSYQKLRIEVVDMDGERVDKLLVSTCEPETPPEEEA